VIPSKRSIRVRLTLWYVGTMAVVLFVFAATSYLVAWHGLSNGIEHLPLEAASFRRSELNELLIVLGLGLPLALGVAGFGGYILVRRTLVPISMMTDRAQTITAENLSDRLPVENPEDEIGQLATVFNQTLERLENSFSQLKRFTADASHELRTPLTAIRSVGEVGLRERRNEGEYRETIGSMLEEVDRLSHLVDSLLTLTRADAGHVQIHPERVDIGNLMQEVARYLSALAEEKSQTVEVAIDSGLFVDADRLVFRQAIINIVDNAIKYSPLGAHIRLSASRSAESIVIEISDNGPGIDPQHHERIFDRFYRVDQARSRHLGGAGLGLAIAKWAVQANDGSIELQKSLGAGSTFQIRLPAIK
jgi:Signal transduction histidine kinase